ncbi:hypothetical protein PTSG_12393 [Salpingoeca rosetta]|uniref:Uncharacterized protein n=1 Tax=Salpingoeca rosetta (strain ATCC 50818 / BSB-021) TaxID=946362 RepID=F2UDP0_SALR5|nr:uncharacterized protein PTSG_12393 [Salpingoeca rosetta]EGD74735.1 hypothetical protein PTSG_12393 [Salpingoeca rosetta]|eukprot:XP_004992992.1 hypothetical protein PTSG_12393 [Salpingoeca rosetta]
MGDAMRARASKQASKTLSLSLPIPPLSLFSLFSPLPSSSSSSSLPPDRRQPPHVSFCSRTPSVLSYRSCCCCVVCVVVLRSSPPLPLHLLHPPASHPLLQLICFALLCVQASIHPPLNTHTHQPD